jgi:hypothetical protein
MRLSKTALVLLMGGLLAIVGGSAVADIPPGPRPRPTPSPLPEPKPDPAPAPPTGPGLLIQPSPGAREAVLRIPRKLLPPGDAPKAKADAGFSPTQTIVAGLAMTAAVSLLGLHLVRRRGRTLAMSLVGGMVAIGVTSSIILANAAPIPPDRRRPNPPAENKVDAGQFGLRKMPLKIEIVDQGEDAVLTADPAMLEPLPGAKPPVAQPNALPPPPG